MLYAIFDPITNSFGLTNSEPMDGETFYEVPEGTDPDALYVKEGEIRFMPPRPAPYLTFNFGTEVWEDQRTTADYDAYVLSERSGRSAPKIVFLREIARSWLTHDDVVDMAVGYFPPPILDALSSLNAVDLLATQLEWIATTEVARLNSLVTLVADYYGASAEDIDALFGITLYPPPAP